MPTILTAGDGTNGAVITSASDNALTIQTGPNGGKVNAIALASDGTATFLKNPVSSTAQSMVRVNTSNGYGSSSTAIRKFSNVTNGVNGCVIQGSDITFANDATLGASATIVTSGVYSISFNDNGSTNMCVGVSLNTTQPTAACYSLTNLGEILITGVTAGTNIPTAVNWTGYLAAGSVVRPHNDGTAVGIAARCQFTITRVA